MLQCQRRAEARREFAWEYTDVPIRRHLYAQTIGQIDQLGDGVSGFQLGDQVADMTVLGSNASYRTLRADDLTRVPAGVDVTEAAAIILSWTTAYQLLHRAGDHGRLRKP
jgi:NADPH:quinone reductase-like Zn-dependent oxidoreductase